jgi:predicted membrane protein
VVNASEFLRYWPALLIIYGGVKILQPDTSAGRFWGAVVAFFGMALLADKLYIFDFRLWDFWPLLLVALGAMMIWRTSASRTQVKLNILSAEKSSDESSVVTASAFLGGTKRNIHTRDFRGGELTAVMGGCEIDLRGAAITNSPAVIDVFTFWGGIEIKVPQNWTVSFEGTPILGGYDDKTFRQAPATDQRLIVRGTIIMGGVQVSN